jgi:hypothetical protein
VAPGRTERRNDRAVARRVDDLSLPADVMTLNCLRCGFRSARGLLLCGQSLICARFVPTGTGDSLRTASRSGGGRLRRTIKAGAGGGAWLRPGMRII